MAKAPNVTLSDGHWSDVLFFYPSTKVILLIHIHILVCLFLRKTPNMHCTIIPKDKQLFMFPSVSDRRKHNVYWVTAILKIHIEQDQDRIRSDPNLSTESAKHPHSIVRNCALKCNSIVFSSIMQLDSTKRDIVIHVAAVKLKIPKTAWLCIEEVRLLDASILPGVPSKAACWQSC